MKAVVPALAVLLGLTACDSGPQGSETTAEASPSAVDTSADGTAAPIADSGTPAPTALPAAMHGRWGLVPADCTSTLGDAKGLLTVSATELEFYESVGTLDTVMQAEPGRIRASFDFEGEGMTWERELVLEVEDDGATLVRREYGADAAPGPFRYARCN